MVLTMMWVQIEVLGEKTIFCRGPATLGTRLEMDVLLHSLAATINFHPKRGRVHQHVVATMTKTPKSPWCHFKRPQEHFSLDDLRTFLRVKPQNLWVYAPNPQKLLLRVVP